MPTSKDSDAVGNYIQTVIPQDAVIESWEWAEYPI
jgi:hypothetical protein